MRVLGIESSCDETAAGIVVDGRRLEANVISSQVDVHTLYGGVVPEVASRLHIERIVPVVRAALSQAGVGWDKVDAIAVTNGPGLAGALIVGANFAKGLSATLGLPLIGVNHLAGHIYAGWLVEGIPDPGIEPGFPLLCLLVSGGHTDLAVMEGHGRFTLIGRTRDDAAGEAFDKGARILGLGYPGGPVIERAARVAPVAEPMPRAWLRESHDFSFSGVKTALLRRAQEMGINAGNLAGHVAGPQPDTTVVGALARGYQEAIVDVLIRKTVDAAEQFGVRGIMLGGGVAANRSLRDGMLRESPVPVIVPPPLLCTDNGAMIAACGSQLLALGLRSDWTLDVLPNLKLDYAIG
ncbi:MAG: tRNA (adenosine(37)-N6)-threonylcarbamoyltransferase complex transferase subunit TsaD [Chloroflexi bacterium]|nr:tRNA (adenosine(37)-N6)-threonylcarbamoyltransferase complex transferase subunit TsaD [Chloroflexota bacterium]